LNVQCLRLVLNLRLDLFLVYREIAFAFLDPLALAVTSISLILQKKKSAKDDFFTSNLRH
jgi:hypothetical protein